MLQCFLNVFFIYSKYTLIWFMRDDFVEKGTHIFVAVTILPTDMVKEHVWLYDDNTWIVGRDRCAISCCILFGWLVDVGRSSSHIVRWLSYISDTVRILSRTILAIWSQDHDGHLWTSITVPLRTTILERFFHAGHLSSGTAQNHTVYTRLYKCFSFQKLGIHLPSTLVSQHYQNIKWKRSTL